MTEKQVQSRVISKLKERGRMVIKMTVVSMAGFPDLLVLPGDGKCYFVECKAPGKRPSKLQEIIHIKLRERGYDVLVIDNTDNL